MPKLRLLSDEGHDGPSNMARDEALLECASLPTLRLYTWHPPAISLGYFQDHASVIAQVRSSAGLAAQPLPCVVRRITGGGAIWHQHEVTYCLVGVLGEDGFPTASRAVYPLLHHAVAQAILELGGQRITVQASSQGDRRYREEPRCFASPAIDDLTASNGGGKILGSAARQRGRRILVHGSLKLSSNPWDGPTVVGCGLDQDAAALALQRGISAALGATLEPGALGAPELQACARIAHERYGNRTWVEARQGPRP